MNFSKLTEFLDLMSAERTPGCVACVTLDGEVVYEHSSGVSSLESGAVMTGDEYFNIYSCSKVMTVTAALNLLERGKFLLTDPIAEYIPEYSSMKIKNPDGSLRDATRQITVGDLFSMTAGFTYNLNAPSVKYAREITQGRMDTATVTRLYAAEPLSFEPGSHWQYSVCHDILAGLVSIIEGKPFREHVKEVILDPLGMTETVYHTTPEILAKTAEQYRFDVVGEGEFDAVEAQRVGASEHGKFTNIGREVSGFILGPEYDSGGAGITTTCRDYVKLVAALAGNGLGMNGNRILAPETVALLKTNRLGKEQLADLNWAQLRGYGYGLGVRTHIDRAASGSIARLGEFGWGGAAGATVIVDSELGLGAFFVQHTLNPREGWYQPRLKNVVYGCIE